METWRHQTLIRKRVGDLHTPTVQAIGIRADLKKENNGERERGGAKWVVSHVLMDWMDGKGETKQRYEKYTDILRFLLFRSVCTEKQRKQINI